MPQSFAGSEAKLARAKEQLDVLYAQLMIALDPSEHPVRAEIDTYPQPKPPGVTDPRPWTAFTIYVSDAPVFGSETGLLLGEIVHNFRGSLDHLAWALVKRRSSKRLTAREQRVVAFPMAQNRRSFWNRVSELLPGVPLNQRTFIERYQPYRRSTAGRAMRRLRNLSDTDKHRIIVPTLLLPKTGDLNIKYEGAELVETTFHLKFGREVKKGTKLLTVTLAGGEPGKRKVSMEGIITSVPFLPRILVKPPPPEDAVLLEIALNEISATCSEILNEIKAHL